MQGIRGLSPARKCAVSSPEIHLFLILLRLAWVCCQTTSDVYPLTGLLEDPKDPGHPARVRDIWRRASPKPVALEARGRIGNLSSIRARVGKTLPLPWHNSA